MIQGIIILTLTDLTKIISLPPPPTLSHYIFLSPPAPLSLLPHWEIPAGEDGGEERPDPVQGGHVGVRLQQALYSPPAHHRPRHLPEALPHSGGSGGLRVLQRLLLHQEADQQELLQVAGEKELGDEETLNYEWFKFSVIIRLC